MTNAKKQRKKKQSAKDQRALQENQKYQVNTSCQYGHDKGQKLYGLTDAENVRKGGKNTQKNYTKEILMMQIAPMM